VLRPFFEAYYVIAATLAFEGSVPLTEESLTERALRMGGELASHGDISNQDAVSTALFATVIKLAASRGLLDGPEDDREQFRLELREILDTLDAIGSWKPYRSNDPDFTQLLA